MRNLLTAVLLCALSACQNDPAVPEYDGGSLYAANCSNCHGIYGEGDGVVAPTLDVVLLDLRYLTQRNGGAYPADFVRKIIDGRETRAAHGPSGMPVWGAVLTQQEGIDEAAQARVEAKIGSLVEFLGSIQQTD